ncbi:MAG TPA: DUF6600 domain-containing protein [Candidatus Acidoferrales bacterium]|nr:DUF6600 domain-containing protein [Candidatus Acidoferrales bacterium]
MTLFFLVWEVWFFTATLIENSTILCKNRFMKGVRAMKKLGSLLTLLFLGACVILPKPASAQDQNTQDQSAQDQYAQDQNGPDQTAQDENVDPPSRVARLSYTRGSVSYQVSGDSDWVAADPNRPLTTNDNLWVDRDSLGELHVGSTAIRLSGETGISVLNLDDRTAQFQLAQGTIEVHLRNLEAGDAWEFDTPNLSFTLASAGEYLISTDPNSNVTTIVVREGAGTVTGGGDSWDLRAGRQYTFSGTDQLAYSALPQPGYDDFESWCQQRDQAENDSPSAQYVSRDVDGYYQLDSNGTWSEVPDYGPVWIPNNVPVDWAPYHAGHWVWISPWGWTWVDAEPWGWAPFHYGRWVLVGAHWGWVPGPRVVRPVYAPALVGFVGGNSFALSVSFGGGFTGVAWFPLGPRDVYVPGYRCSERYVQVINVTNTRVINVTRVNTVYRTVVVNREVNHYEYENDHRAVVAVSHDTFVNARPVRTNTVRVNQDQLRNVRVVENTRLAPTRASYVSSTVRVSTARPAVPFSQRPVVANLPPPKTVRNPQPRVYTNDNRPFNQPGNRGNTSQPTGNQRDNGFRPFTPPNQTRTVPPNTRLNQNENQTRTDENRGNDNFDRNKGRANENVNREGGQPNQPGSRQYNPPPNQGNRQYAPPPSQPESHVRFAPPVRERDQNYDVHPPLNQKPGAQPRNENRPQSKPESKPKSESKPDKGKPR